MKSVNQFYSLYQDESKRHQYDLKELGEKQFRMIDTAFFYADGRMVGGEPIDSPTTKEDYDGKFREALLHINPLHKIKDFIEHHYIWYTNGKPLAFKEQFINQIKYVTMASIKNTITGHADEVREWLQKKKDMLHQKQLQEKNEYLKKAYEAAYEHSKSSPLSVSLKPVEFGESIGYDKNTSTRIVMELVSEGYATSGLGMKMLMITQDGLNYLRRIESETHRLQVPPVNLTVGDGSTVQFQNGTINSTQSIEVKEPSKEELLQFIQEVRSSLPELSKHLDVQDAEELQNDIEYLEKNANRDKPNNEATKTVLKGVGGVLKKVSESVLTSVISSYLKSQGYI